MLRVKAAPRLRDADLVAVAAFLKGFDADAGAALNTLGVSFKFSSLGRARLFGDALGVAVAVGVAGAVPINAERAAGDFAPRPRLFFLLERTATAGEACDTTATAADGCDEAAADAKAAGALGVIIGTKVAVADAAAASATLIRKSGVGAGAAADANAAATP